VQQMSWSSNTCEGKVAGRGLLNGQTPSQTRPDEPAVDARGAPSSTLRSMPTPNAAILAAPHLERPRFAVNTGRKERRLVEGAPLPTQRLSFTGESAGFTTPVPSFMLLILILLMLLIAAVHPGVFERSSVTRRSG